MLPVVLVAAVLVQNPASHVVPDAVTCSTCTITLTPVTKLGAVDGPGSLPGRPNVFQASGGKFWVTPLDYPHPMIFRADGRFIQEFGRTGEGPGEVRRPSVTAALPGDSILITDPPRGMHVVTPNLSIARTIRGFGFTQVTPVHWPDAVIAYDQSLTSRAPQPMFALYDFSGKNPVIKKVLLRLATNTNPNDPVVTARVMNENLRTVSNASNGHVWIAQRTRYSLVRIGLDGQVQDSLVRNPEWFSGTKVITMGNERTLPNPRVTDVTEDAQGRIWVFLAKPRASALKAWRDSQVKLKNGGEARVSSLPAMYKLFQTEIEVIDPKRRTVIARKTLDDYISNVISPTRVVSFVENDDGVPMATVWNLSFREH